MRSIYFNTSTSFLITHKYPCHNPTAAVEFLRATIIVLPSFSLLFPTGEWTFETAYSLDWRLPPHQKVLPFHVSAL